MNITRQFADYALGIRYKDIPAKTINVQKHVLLDILGVMLGAVGLGDGCQELLRYVRSAGSGNCSIVGTNETSSPELAALMNGALAHALDFEDSQDAAMQHSNSVPTPVCLTLADYLGGISGKEFITASAIGSDIACRLATGLDVDLVSSGWYMQPVHGSMAAVFAGARILGLTVDQTLDAVATNMYQMSGSAEVVNSPDSLIRSIRDGLGAKSAVFSLMLAKSGLVTRFEHAFEGKYGYYQAYAPGKFTLERAAENLGTDFLSTYVGFKPWPCCRLTHPAVGALLEIMKQNDLNISDIEHIHVVLSKVSSMVVEPNEIKYAPQNTINAKFSIPFSLGVAAKKRSLELADFECNALNDPDILALAQKVTYEFDESLEKSQILHTVIDVTARGKHFREIVTAPHGSPERPMTDRMFVEKFKSCAKYAGKSFTEAELDIIINMILNVEQLSDMRELLTLL